MRLTETSVQWGNINRLRYFLNGRRISESHANYILKNHMQERDGAERDGVKYRAHWNIGPRHDAPLATYDQDCM